ncbi:DUF2514 family protein [Pseudomonas piscis]|uniref:DUF2514 family protein n=1 Tax=Pseudomonas piscis TaxID=2614538 RepID=A0ABY9NB36_9PSED|nr:DUF2514 family protein [Pseudomonas piscis]WMN14953.1 DUF2514 family protein [Pseudomonas piscis]
MSADGVLLIALLMPYDEATATDAIRFPEPVTVTVAGTVDIPTDHPAQPPVTLPGCCVRGRLSQGIEVNAWVLRAGALLLILASYWGIYQHGRSVEGAEWQARWSARDAGDKQAWANDERAERDNQQARQNSINKAVQDGQRKIDSAVADAVTARAAADSLQRTVDDLTSCIASQGRSHSCTAAASAAGARTGPVLVKLFKRADARARDLAADADQSRGRGVTCEQVYDSLAR